MNQNAQLASLGDNGGATQTHALLPGSPAVDAGSAALAVDEDGNPLATDQRGVLRVQGSAPDIGAYEVGQASPPIVTNPFFDNVTNSSARLYGTVTSEGGSPLTRRGIVYAPTSVTSNPRLGGTGVIVDDDPLVNLGTFNRTLTGLNPSTSYSFAAFAANDAVTGYSPVATFQTNPAPGGGSLVVTTIADEDNGTSDPGMGAGTSLREAIAYADALGGDRTITFSPNLFANGPATLIAYVIQPANLTGITTIEGPGAALLTIDGNGTQIFSNSGGLRLNGMTLANGFNGSDGGAIRSLGTLYANDCVFINNASGSRGGAIYNGNNGYLSRCTFVNNSAASSYGGAIANEGALWAMNCTFTGNSADHGGAIANMFSASSIRATCSTITGNSASASGGAIFVNNPDRVFLYNAIVSGNSAPSGANLSDTPNTGLFSSLIDADPAAIFTTGLLANNGGTTPTIALKPGGPAINAGTNSLAVDQNFALLTTDQRGVARLLGNTVDIGAFEAIPAPVVTANPQDQTALVGVTVTFDASATSLYGGTAPYALTNGATLLPDQYLLSPNHAYKLLYQTDGNLVLYRGDGLALWASNTGGQTPGQVIMQADGNLVIYGPSGAQFATDTYGNPNAVLLLQNDGNLVIYAAGPIFATGTVQAGPSNPVPNVQWQVSTDQGANFTDIAGATGVALSFGVTPSQNDNRYRAVFSNGSGLVAFTAPATLTVRQPPAITSADWGHLHRRRCEQFQCHGDRLSRADAERDRNITGWRDL